MEKEMDGAVIAGYSRGKKQHLTKMVIGGCSGANINQNNKNNNNTNQN
jgi:hypothetical protein